MDLDLDLDLDLGKIFIHLVAGIGMTGSARHVITLVEEEENLIVKARKKEEEEEGVTRGLVSTANFVSSPRTTLPMRLTITTPSRGVPVQINSKPPTAPITSLVIVDPAKVRGS